MMLKLIKLLWMAASVAVLLATLYFYDGKDLSDVWVFATWLMLALTFPAGVVISLAHFMVGELFAITVKTSYLSLCVEWSAYLVLGYLQWFRLVPFIAISLQRYIKQKNSRKPVT